MITKQNTKDLTVLIGTVVCAFWLMGCGNKGDLFLVPDALTQQDLQRLEQTLDETGDSDRPDAPTSNGDPAEQPSVPNKKSTKEKK